MTAQPPDPKIISRVAALLMNEEIMPVLIGGMAMVVYGSTRMTRDCDFAAKKNDETLRRSVVAMMNDGFGVIFGWDAAAYEPTKVEMEKDIAAPWAVIDRPESIWFWHPTARVRIDLVFDLPVPIEDLHSRSQKRTIEGTRILIAAPEDLKRMKEKALADRPSRITDEQDLVYLRYLISNAKRS